MASLLTKDNTLLLSLFPLFLLFLPVPPVNALYSINGTSPRATGNSPILTSPSTNFTLQWSPVAGNKFNLAIIYLVGTVGSPCVWTANRNYPVTANATLVVDPATGNLLIREGDGRLIWSTNVTSGGQQLDLLNSGNLVLTDAKGGEIWQSFDHPSDTLLPTQPIRTGQRVIAGLSLEDTREGNYTVAMMPGGLIMFVQFDYGSWPYQVLGFYEKNTVQSVQNPACYGTQMTYSPGGGAVIFQQEDTGAGCNLTFHIPVGSNDDVSLGVLKFFRLDSDGNFRTYFYREQYGWSVDQEVFSGSTACSLPNRCGNCGMCTGLGTCTCPSTISKQNLLQTATTCERISEPICGSKANELIELSGVNYFVNDFINQSLTSQADCRKLCADSCNCSAAFYDSQLSLCYRYNDVMSLRQDGNPRFTAFIKVNNLGLTQAKPSSGLVSKQVLIGIIVGAILFIGGLIGLVLIILKQQKKMGDIDNSRDFMETLPGLPNRFSYRELSDATRRFKHKLGGGGFGSVYEGKLKDGSKVAVKRLESARQGHKEFHAEVAALGNMSHVNLVRLRGFCIRGKDRLLVYEYLPNGSLEKWLFHKEKEGKKEDKNEKLLDWDTRCKIAIDTARGLAFLHEESRERIVHLDIKPQNILLDDDFTAKLSDFGLSKLMDRQNNDIVTNMKGTPGYLAPEWLLGAVVTSKSDVYSYGMVLLELVSGKRNMHLVKGSQLYFPAWIVLQVELHGSMEDIGDSRLGITPDDSHKWASLVRMIKVAFWCIQEDPSARPSMTTVLHMLEGLTEVDEPPSLLQFAYRTINSKSVIDSFQKESSSIDVTNLVLSAPR